MKTMTVRNIPEEVADYLSTVAKERQQSINATVLSLLQKSMGRQPGLQKKRDLAAFENVWTASEARQFEQDTAVFEQIDEELWK